MPPLTACQLDPGQMTGLRREPPQPKATPHQPPLAGSAQEIAATAAVVGFRPGLTSQITRSE